ncbi:SDR family NAD(P)-dependent oxidoreductase [Rugosimonospora acidiphila]|uniref:SDR family NAD(P)-dependent oxidoreductase n=1 Tax=Rugosimonospora acidiphila TaxID=556531 RepID=A0ABP9RQL2_9ACTN
MLGVGPGLGLSIAHRFGREGFVAALVSRDDTRHPGYRARLSKAGIESRGYVADVTDPAELSRALDRIAADLGRIDTAYFGPADPNVGAGIAPLPDARGPAIRSALEAMLIPPVNLVAALLPAMLRRGDGALLFAGGLSGKHPMPMLGSLAPASAALRMYALTLHEAVKDRGVYVGTLTIGGLIERGDIHRTVQARLERSGTPVPATLDPDRIADAAWSMYVNRGPAETEFNALGV